MNRWEHLLEAVEVERQHEEDYYSNLSKSKSISERIEAGFLWNPVSIIRAGYTVGEYIEVSLERTRHFEFGHKFKVGVSIRFFSEEQDESYRGSVAFVRRNEMRIILSSSNVSLDDLKGRWSVELLQDERSYKEMAKALNEIMSTTDPRVQELKKNVETLSFYEKKEAPQTFTHPSLNQSQIQAINGLTNIEQLGIIHGPPGTGKTTTIVHLVNELLKKEKKILVCAPSNNAVDLLAERLNKKGIRVVRLGNISRVSDAMMDLTLAERARNHVDWKHIKKVKVEAEEAKRQANKYKRNFGAQERKMRSDLYREAKELRKWARDLEDKLVDSILKDAQVIATTLVGAAHSYVKDYNYQTLIIDEASQALEPACWIPMLQADKTILVGDHLQLPPTVKSSKAMEMGLNKTLLSRLDEPLASSYLLNVQYRMNEAILAYSNQIFYKGALTSGESVANWTLPSDNQPVELIDTAGCGFEEKFDTKNSSRFNPDEFTVIVEHIVQIKEKLLGASIGIISPYAQQVRHIEQELSDTPQLEDLNIKVNTIDGFQGQERDVIYISLVRSNEQNEIGFLKDYRRMNVAMTRAKKKLVIVGDFACLSTDDFYGGLFDHIDKHATYRTAWEFMSY